MATEEIICQIKYKVDLIKEVETDITHFHTRTHGKEERRLMGLIFQIYQEDIHQQNTPNYPIGLRGKFVKLRNLIIELIHMIQIEPQRHF